MRARIPLLPAVLLATLPTAAYAHAGLAPEPHDVWSAWALEPTVLIGTALAALLYRRGLRALWTRAGVGHGVARWQARCYYAGLVALLVALVSPLDAVADALFSAHMVQHLILIVVAAPLLAAGAPLLVYLWALPGGGRRAVRRAWSRAGRVRKATRVLLGAFSAWILHAVALWAWHVPALYDLAVANEWVHALEHTCFLVTGTLFWWVVLPRGGALRRSHGAAMLYVFAFALQATLLGAFLTLSSRVLYHAHLHTTAAWGLTPLQDQQLAGVVMWVPCGVVYLAAMIGLFLLWMREAERRVTRREAAAQLSVGPG
jgi:cytochrome c oxidase assembly factor CtaG